MTVRALWLPDNERITVTGSGYAPGGAIQWEAQTLRSPLPEGLRALIEAAALCNDAQLIAPDNQENRWRTLGDPTEAALLTLALKGGIDPESLRREWPRRAEIPFDSKVTSTRVRGFPSSLGAPRFWD